MDTEIARIKAIYEKNVGNEEEIYARKLFGDGKYRIAYDANGGTGTMNTQEFQFGIS